MAFFQWYPPFGALPGRSDRESYARRAAGHYKDGVFVYPDEWGLAGVSSDERVSEKGTVPAQPLPVRVPALGGAGDDVRVTWLGHSTLVIEMHGKRLLVDPVFSRRCSPVAFAGPKRYSDPGTAPAELGAIDAVLITHDHYDHLDYASIRALRAQTARFIVPLGVEARIARWVGGRERITALDWWEAVDLDGLEIILTPARHQSGRTLSDRGRTLYGSYVLRDGRCQIFESGDTGYGGHFAEIGRRYGAFDLVMTDGAQYNMPWHGWHMFPEESAMAAETLGARYVMPIHWGSFVLSTHGWDDPPERLTRACEERGLTVVTPRLGETMSLDAAENYQDRWWRDLP